MSLENIIVNVGTNTVLPRANLDLLSVESKTFKLDSNPTNGYFLTSDGSGVGTWAEPAFNKISVTQPLQYSGNNISLSYTGNFSLDIDNKLDTVQDISTTSNVQFNSMTLLGPIVCRGTATNITTSNFGQLALNTAKQNTVGYDIMIIYSISVTPTTTASLEIGTDLTNVVATNPFILDFTTSQQFLIPILVPAGYWVKVANVGAVTVVSENTFAMQCV